MMQFQSKTRMFTIELPVAQWLGHPARSQRVVFKSHLELGLFSKLMLHVFLHNEYDCNIQHCNMSIYYSCMLVGNH